MSNNEIEKKRTMVEVIVYVVCLLLLAGFFMYNYTVSRYSTGVESEFTAEAKDFDVDFQLRYNDGVDHTVLASDLSSAHGILRLTVPQYSTLQLDTIYKGEGKCYYRFKVTESWLHKSATDEDMLTPRALSDYNLSSDFYDNRSDDGYIYCKTALTGNSPSAVITTNAITSCIPGIDAPDLISSDDVSTLVDIAVEIEGVQWNRAKELWHLSKLPWE